MAYRRVGDRRWTEIDYPEDIRRAEEEILPAVESRE
jgi:choline kinase